MSAVTQMPGKQYPKGLFAKLHAVMRDCSYIQKDKKNDFHGYKYVSEAAIKERFHQSFLEHGLLFFPISANVVDTAPRGEKGEVVTTVRLRYKFVDIEDGTFEIGEIDGQGSDKLDKGVYKAITGALKYALTATCMVPTGDDPEEFIEEKKSAAEAKAEAKERAAAIERELKSAPQDEQSFMAQLGMERPKINARLTKFVMEQLPTAIGSTATKKFQSDMLSKFNVKLSKELTIPQLREVTLGAYRLMRDGLAVEPEAAEEQVIDISEGDPLNEDEELELMQAELVDIASTIRIFHELRARMVGLVGEDKAEILYRQTLAFHKQKSSNGFRGDLVNARLCMADLYRAQADLAREAANAK